LEGTLDWFIASASSLYEFTTLDPINSTQAQPTFPLGSLVAIQNDLGVTGVVGGKGKVSIPDAFCGSSRFQDTG
jgi:hypothetical protein